MKRNIFLSAIFCLGLIAMFAQDTFKQADMSIIAETDKLVKAGADDIYVHIKGTGNSVVFVSGLGEDHKNWEQVQDNIAPFAQTFSYDRSGLGKSSYKIKQKDLPSLVFELKKTLQSARINKPYLLVGHSLGCQIVKQFAVMFPKDVRGIIFIDPGFNEELLELTLDDSVWQQRENELKKYRPKIGIAREAELKELNNNCSIADDITKLPDVPVVLFTATRINPDFPGSKEELKVKKQTHERWLQSIPGGKQIIVPQSRHYVQNDVPELVIDEIKKMLNA